MTGGPLVLTYHAVDEGPPPLCIPPRLFRDQLELIAESGARVVGLPQLVEAAERGEGRGLVAITFDDGFASVIEDAVPALSERGWPATVFCVAAHLGATNDWPSEPSRSPRRRLASASALREAAAGGPLELGSHGMTHRPLQRLEGAALRREIADSRSALEEATGLPVRWLAYPFGISPGREGDALVRSEYAGACAGGNRRVDPGDRFAVPRVDPHYLRRPWALRRALAGADAHLALRRAGGRLRRVMRKDYGRG